MNKKHFFPLLILLFSAPIYAQTEPTDKLATPETRNLYLNLQRLSKKKQMLFGHQDDLYRGKGWENVPGRSDIKELTGQYPAVLGSDLGKIELGGEKNVSWQKFTTQTTHIQQFYRQGGVNTIAWHMNNPVDPTQGMKSTQDSTIYYLFADPKLIERYHSWMDAAADYLLSLKGDNGEPVPVLLRLFHEHTGSWFWWGKSHCTPEEYIKMFRYTVDYLRNTRNVHNLLIVYCPDVFETPEEYLERYPGDAYVDVLGFDLYDKDRWHPANTYVDKGRRMIRILNDINKDKKKVTAVAETGFNHIPVYNWFTKTVMPVIKNSGISYVVLWSIGKNNFFSPYIGHPSAPDFQKLAKKKWLLFEEDVRQQNIYQPIK